MDKVLFFMARETHTHTIGKDSTRVLYTKYVPDDFPLFTSHHGNIPMRFYESPHYKMRTPGFSQVNNSAPHPNTQIKYWSGLNSVFKSK